MFIVNILINYFTGDVLVSRKAHDKSLDKIIVPYTEDHSSTAPYVYTACDSTEEQGIWIWDVENDWKLLASIHLDSDVSAEFCGLFLVLIPKLELLLYRLQEIFHQSFNHTYPWCILNPAP